MSILKFIFNLHDCIHYRWGQSRRRIIVPRRIVESLAYGNVPNLAIHRVQRETLASSNDAYAYWAGPIPYRALALRSQWDRPRR
jgi:hypothetical protein